VMGERRASSDAATRLRGAAGGSGGPSRGGGGVAWSRPTLRE